MTETTHAPRSRYGGLSDENAGGAGFTDEELALMVEQTSYRKAADATGIPKGTLQNAVERHRKALAAEAERAIEQARLNRQALNILPEQDEAPDADEAEDERAPIAIPNDTKIVVGAQRTGGIGSLFLKASTHSDTNPDDAIPLTIISMSDWDAAIAWARSPFRDRVTDMPDPTGGRGFVMLPTFQANPSEAQAAKQDTERTTYRAWMAQEFHARGWIVRYGKDVPSTEADRSSFSRIFVIAGSAVECLALIGHQWNADLLRRQCRILVFDARNEGNLPGQTKATDIDNRVLLDSFTLDIGSTP